MSAIFSFKQLTDSWSAYVKPLPSKNAAKAVEEPQIEQQTNEDNVNDASSGLLSSFTSGLGGWIFSPPEETTTELSQVCVAIHNDLVKIPSYPTVVILVHPLLFPRRKLKNIFLGILSIVQFNLI
jgi:hypothetical protein